MAHYYCPKTLEARHFVQRADGKGTRPTTIADARKNGWVPSVTTILNVLRKPALENWKIRQAVHAVVTAPDVAGEMLDAKIERILETERQQDEEAQKAADLGSGIHAELERLLSGGEATDSLFTPYAVPIYEHLIDQGKTIACELTAVNSQFGGKIDFIQDTEIGRRVFDFKTTRNIPNKPYPEHRMQISAYAFMCDGCKRDSALESGVSINESNISAHIAYISTSKPGEFAIYDVDWWKDFDEGFEPCLSLWRHLNRLA